MAKTKETIKDKKNIDSKEIKDVTVPYLVTEAVLCSPGIWNGVKFTKENILEAFSNTKFDKTNSSIFLDHNESATSWIGEVSKIRISEDGKMVGDLVIVDENVAKKLAYGAHYGISPAIEMDTKDVKTMKSFKFINFSIVFMPAIEDALLVDGEEKVKEDINMSKEKSKNVAEFIEWTTEEKNNLPDSAFAVIEPDYIKGITKDKNARHLPHHNNSVKGTVSENGVIEGDSDESVDLPHYKNALARVNQIKPVTNISQEELLKLAMAHLDKHHDLLDVESEEEVDDVEETEMPMKKQEYVMKEQFDNLVKEFKSLKEAYAIEKLNFSKDAAKLSDSLKIIEQKDKLISTYEERVISAEAKVAKFEEEIQKEIMQRRQAKFEAVFDKYCRFHRIPEAEKMNTKRELGTLSDSVLETIDRDVSRAIDAYSTKSEIIQNSEQLNAISVDMGTNVVETPEGKMDILFEKMRLINK